MIVLFNLYSSFSNNRRGKSITHKNIMNENKSEKQFLISSKRSKCDFYNQLYNQLKLPPLKFDTYSKINSKKNAVQQGFN